jgi:hypothetical protein
MCLDCLWPYYSSISFFGGGVVVVWCSFFTTPLLCLSNFRGILCILNGLHWYWQLRWETYTLKIFLIICLCYRLVGVLNKFHNKQFQQPSIYEGEIRSKKFGQMHECRPLCRYLFPVQILQRFSLGPLSIKGSDP